MIKQKIEQDLKSAMLARDKTLAEALRNIKSAVLNAEIALGKRDQGLDDQEIIPLLQKEQKKRRESAGFYEQAGNSEQAQAELYEEKIIGNYLPVQMTDAEIKEVVDEIIASMGGRDQIDAKSIGQVIGQVKKRTGGLADGGRIAAFVKESLI